MHVCLLRAEEMAGDRDMRDGLLEGVKSLFRSLHTQLLCLSVCLSVSEYTCILYISKMCEREKGWERDVRERKRWGGGSR